MNRLSELALRVAIVDDDDQVLSSTFNLLSRAGFVTRAFHSADEFMRSIQAHEDFEIILMDVRMPPIDGVDLYRKIRSLLFHSNIIFVTGFGSIDLAVEAIKLGAWGFLEKPCSPDRMIEVVRTAGEAALAKRMESSSINEFVARFKKLPPSQRRVANLLSEGLTAKEIARETGLTQRTVETYRMWIMERLNVKSLAEFVKLKTLSDRSDHLMDA